MIYGAGAVVAALLGAMAFPPRRYRFWRKWSKALFVGGFVIILLINGAFGALGAVAAHLASWKPFHSDLANGASFGVLGLALVRVQAAPGLDIAKPESSYYILAWVLGWVVALLDDNAANTIRVKLTRLDDLALRQLTAYILKTEVLPDPKLDSLVKASSLDEMTSADKRLKDGDPMARIDLLAFCVLQNRTRHLVLDRV